MPTNEDFISDKMMPCNEDRLLADVVQPQPILMSVTGGGKDSSYLPYCKGNGNISNMSLVGKQYFLLKLLLLLGLIYFFPTDYNLLYDYLTALIHAISH